MLALVMTASVAATTVSALGAYVPRDWKEQLTQEPFF